jgi:hypothetical protein
MGRLDAGLALRAAAVLGGVFAGDWGARSPAVGESAASHEFAVLRNELGLGFFKSDCGCTI